MKQKRKTTGEFYLEEYYKEVPEVFDAEELSREMQKKYIKNIHDCIDKGKKAFDGDFFIEVQTKKERLTPNVIQRIIFGRRTCPYPFYDQTVYHYHSSADDLEFLWVVPDKMSCIEYKENMLLIPADGKELLYQIIDFFDGTLIEKQAKINSALYRKEVNGRGNQFITGSSNGAAE